KRDRVFHRNDILRRNAEFARAGGRCRDDRRFRYDRLKHRYAKAFRVRRRYKNIESRIKLRRIVDPIEPKKIVRNAENGGEPFKFAAKCFVERIVFTRDQKPRIRMFFECFVCRENEFALALYLQKFADRSDE